MIKKLFFLCCVILLSNNLLKAQKTDVWDFGGAVLDTSLYNNQLTVDAINAFYPGVTAGTVGPTVPSTTVLTLTPGVLTFKTGGNDRLYTTNTAITRYGTSVRTTDPNYTGGYYCNGAAALSNGTRIFTMTLNEDDQVTFVASAESTGNTLIVTNSVSGQNESIPIAAVNTATLAKFQAKQAGDYSIYCSLAGKGDFFRILRKAATYTTVSGTVNLSQAPGIAANYGISFTNAAGKTWSSTINSDGTYSVKVPQGFSYTASLTNANGYIITSGKTLDLTAVTDATFNQGISVLKVILFNVTGNVTGLGTAISNLSLTYTPDASTNSIYVPQPTVNKTNSTYSVQLEPSKQYTITALGVNDYQVAPLTITIPSSDTSADLTFTAKQKYNITVTAPELNATQLAALNLTFTNVNETGYVYNFSGINGISLRNSTYAVTSGGLDAYPLQQDLTSYLTVNNGDSSKVLKFIPVTNWSFDDKVITNATPNYKGMSFTGNVANEIAKGHLIGQAGSTITVPMKPGDKMKVSYYYSANFSINGGAAVTSTSGSTSNVESVDYTYPGTSAGNVVINVAGQTYFTEISTTPIVAYSPTITVGSGKNYSTINDALTAVSRMVRDNTQRVTIAIDPGNYEEMIVVNSPNVTLKNASATPSIALNNKGLGIDANAVRITSYYGYGYNYLSQGTDNKYNASVLAVNKANGFTNYTNVSGTTNNSFWNATAVINANNFIAEDIIFENSYNQYISQKESQDVLVLADGNKGVRPTTANDLGVQSKTFTERAAALGVPNNIDKVFLKNCRLVGRQDVFFGGTNARVAVYKGVMMGAVDYIFGGMDVVFYQSAFAMNVSEASSDQSYLTAPQQTSGRGYLLYECKVTSAIPLVETASATRAKPGYFGRPWAPNTGEAVMYKTTVETSDAAGFAGQSLISPAGWLNTLAGTSDRIYEFGTIEQSNVNNSANRVSWSKVLTTPFLTDGTEITTFNFTKGNDNWDPFAGLTTLAVSDTTSAKMGVNAFASGKKIYITEVKSSTEVKVYGMNGSLLKTINVNQESNFDFTTGLYIITLKSKDGIKSVKVLVK
ncbi:T9SS type A sorting domain-containing protein [Halpernia frigidisoli]|uniref:Exo-poly-alpha-galacturonosidase n=1 Tax=Halpernia frigidisoli TaxID=1125876 RepID=A0A1I3IX48_9FLAO|nr:T9SS type A sorting domain-containing protein [Halpernia frigidisoli]SFI52571.1 exo-poly-alpha-galacturonosidase [Halpernia frigidisoli]